eukprot:gene8576-8887_t
MPFAIGDAAVTAAAAIVPRPLARALAHAARYTGASNSADGITTDPDAVKALTGHRDALLAHDAIKACARILAELGVSGHRLPDSKEAALSFGGVLQWAPGDPCTACPLGLSLFIADAAHRKGVDCSADGLLDGDGKPEPFTGPDAGQYLDALRGMFDMSPPPREIAEGVYALRLDPETVLRVQAAIADLVRGNPELCFSRGDVLTPHPTPESAAYTSTAGRLALVPRLSGDSYVVGTVGGWNSDLPPLPALLREELCHILDALRLCSAGSTVTDLARRLLPQRPPTECSSPAVHGELALGGGVSWSSGFQEGGNLGVRGEPFPEGACAIRDAANCYVLTGDARLRAGRTYNPGTSLTFGLGIVAPGVVDGDNHLFLSGASVADVWPSAGPAAAGAGSADPAPPPAQQPAVSALPARELPHDSLFGRDGGDDMRQLQATAAKLPQRVRTHLEQHDMRAPYVLHCGPLSDSFLSEQMWSALQAHSSVQRWSELGLREKDREVVSNWMLSHDSGYREFAAVSSTHADTGYRLLDDEKVARLVAFVNDATDDATLPPLTTERVKDNAYSFNSEAIRLLAACFAVAKHGRPGHLDSLSDWRRQRGELAMLLNPYRRDSHMQAIDRMYEVADRRAGRLNRAAAAAAPQQQRGAAPAQQQRQRNSPPRGRRDDRRPRRAPPREQYSE